MEPSQIRRAQDAMLARDRFARKAARILSGRIVRRSPTENGPPGFATTSTAPASSA